MHIFVFKSQRGNSSKVGFTTWRTGANLPGEFAPWSMIGQGALHAGDPVLGVPGGADTVLSGIQREGFFIALPELRPLRQAGLR